MRRDEFPTTDREEAAAALLDLIKSRIWLKVLFKLVPCCAPFRFSVAVDFFFESTFGMKFVRLM